MIVMMDMGQVSEFYPIPCCLHIGLTGGICLMSGCVCMCGALGLCSRFYPRIRWGSPQATRIQINLGTDPEFYVRPLSFSGPAHPLALQQLACSPSTSDADRVGQLDSVVGPCAVSVPDASLPATPPHAPSAPLNGVSLPGAPLPEAEAARDMHPSFAPWWHGAVTALLARPLLSVRDVQSAVEHGLLGQPNHMRERLQFFLAWYSLRAAQVTSLAALLREVGDPHEGYYLPGPLQEALLALLLTEAGALALARLLDDMRAPVDMPAPAPAEGVADCGVPILRGQLSPCYLHLQLRMRCSRCPQHRCLPHHSNRPCAGHTPRVQQPAHSLTLPRRGLARSR